MGRSGSEPSVTACGSFVMATCFEPTPPDYCRVILCSTCLRTRPIKFGLERKPDWCALLKRSFISFPFHNPAIRTSRRSLEMYRPVSRWLQSAFTACKETTHTFSIYHRCAVRPYAMFFVQRTDPSGLVPMATAPTTCTMERLLTCYRHVN